MRLWIVSISNVVKLINENLGSGYKIHYYLKKLNVKFKDYIFVSSLQTLLEYSVNLNFIFISAYYLLDSTFLLNNFFSIIIDEIKPLNPQAIIIYGSYGRNEGAWILDQKNFNKKELSQFFLNLLTNHNEYLKKKGYYYWKKKSYCWKLLWWV